MHLGILVNISFPIATIIACSSSTNKKEKNLVFDKEGFPIHNGTRITPGGKDFSISRIENHLKKFLRIPSDGSKITTIGVEFNKMGADDIWAKWFLDEVNKSQKTSKWNSGNSTQKWWVPIPKTDTLTLEEFDIQQKHAKRVDKKLLEYVGEIGWKRFFNKKTNKPEFDILINAYTPFDQPKKLKIQLIIIDKIYKDNNNKKYFKIFTLGTIGGIIPNKIKDNFVGSEVEAASVKIAKDKIKTIANIKNWKNSIFKNLVAKYTPLGDDVFDHIIKKLDKKINKDFIESKINELYKLFVDSPYIDINDLFSDKTKIPVVELLLGSKESIKKMRSYSYSLLLVIDYIQINMK